MKKNREMFERDQTKKNCKKYGRSYQQQKYRDTLARELKKQRKKWDKWREIVKTLLEKGKWNSDYFRSCGTRIRGKEVAENLIKYDEDWCRIVACNLRRFRWLLSKEIAETLIDNGFGYLVAPNLSKFEWLDMKTAEKLIDHGQWYFVLTNIDKFEWLDGKKIAKKMIKDKSIHRWDLEEIYRLPWLDEEIAQELTKIWYWYVVEKHLEKFWLKKGK